MRIRERICVILMFAASFALSAQSNDLALKSRNQTNVADVRQIVESSIAATQQHWRARLRYTYMEREVSRRRDSAGRLKSEDVRIRYRDALIRWIGFRFNALYRGVGDALDGTTSVRRHDTAIRNDRISYLLRSLAHAPLRRRCPGSGALVDIVNQVCRGSTEKGRSESCALK